MLLYPTFLLVAVLLGLMLGGSFSVLGQLRLRCGWLMLAGLVARYFLFSYTPGGHRGMDIPLMVQPALMLGLAALAAINWRRPGLWFLALGLLCNAVVLLVNGGHMPVSLAALMATGQTEAATLLSSGTAAGYYVPLVEATRLPFLGDIVMIPLLPIARVFSMGDVLVTCGLFVAVLLGMRPRWLQRSAISARALLRIGLQN